MRPDPYATTSLCPWSGARESTILDTALSRHVRFGSEAAVLKKHPRIPAQNCEVDPGIGPPAGIHSRAPGFHLGADIEP